MRKFFIYLLVSFIALLVSCGKSQEQLDAEEGYSILQQENAQLKEDMESIKEDIQNARDNVEQHAFDDANDDLDSAEQKAEDGY
jgi:hypothetical protein